MISVTKRRGCVDDDIEKERRLVRSNEKETAWTTLLHLHYTYLVYFEGPAVWKKGNDIGHAIGVRQIEYLMQLFRKGLHGG